MNYDHMFFAEVARKYWTEAFNTIWSHRVTLACAKAKSDFNITQLQGAINSSFIAGFSLDVFHPCSAKLCTSFMSKTWGITLLWTDNNTFLISSAAETCLSPDVMCSQTCHKWELCWDSSFERHLAAASSFSICEMYMFTMGFCCSVAIALTQGQGFESHCGNPLWKSTHSWYFNVWYNSDQVPSLELYEICCVINKTFTKNKGSSIKKHQQAVPPLCLQAKLRAKEANAWLWFSFAKLWWLFLSLNGNFQLLLWPLNNHNLHYGFIYWV